MGGKCSSCRTAASGVKVSRRRHASARVGVGGRGRCKDKKRTFTRDSLKTEDPTQQRRSTHQKENQKDQTGAETSAAGRGETREVTNNSSVLGEASTSLISHQPPAVAAPPLRVSVQRTESCSHQARQTQLSEEEKSSGVCISSLVEGSSDAGLHAASTERSLCCGSRISEMTLGVGQEKRVSSRPTASYPSAEGISVSAVVSRSTVSLSPSHPKAPPSSSAVEGLARRCFGSRNPWRVEAESSQQQPPSPLACEEIQRESSSSSGVSLQQQQRRLLPQHLQTETATGDLLLESSVVDGYVMVPWSEHDADIRNNFYLSSEPPRAEPFPFQLGADKHRSGSDALSALPKRANLNLDSNVRSSDACRFFDGGSGGGGVSVRRRRHVSESELRSRETGEGGVYASDGCCSSFARSGHESDLLSEGCSPDSGEEEGGFLPTSHRRFARGGGRGGWLCGKWSDPEGVLALSEKQRSKHFAWRRLSEVVKDPVVFAGPPCSRSIRQGFMGDCSFLSSLAALSEYERAHGVPVLSGLIHPRSPAPFSHSSTSCEAVDCVGCAWKEAAFNPRGIYGVRLFFNGVARKVLVDDFMPVRRDGKLLCAYSANPREVWVSILEKAFGKLMGGTYSVQGSNPGADLYHLTGWVPETVSFRRDLHSGAPPQHKAIVTGGESEDEAKRQVENPLWTRVWRQLSRGLAQGRCVACLGTSELFDAAPSGLRFPEGVSVSTGIVARHAYSVLRHAEVFGKRLLYVKNPWGCMRWKGKFSPSDTASWTPELKAALSYDPEVEGVEDAGCFWIEWRDVVRWFSHLYVCWNSSVFPFVSEIHGKWEESRFLRESSLRDDSYLVAFNPQFRLTIHADGASAASFPPYVSFPSLLHGDMQTRDVSFTDGGGSRHTSVSSCADDSFVEAPVEVWVLLSRHIRQRHKDLTKKYLTVHVHEGRERLACPSIPTKPGIYSNGECTLLKIRLDPKTLTERPGGGDVRESAKTTEERGTRLLRALEYVLVVSQYSQKDEFNFTLKVLAHVPTSLEPLSPLFPDSFSSTYYKGSWTEANAGGCSNNMWRYFKNPQVRLSVPRPLDAVFFLESPEEHSVNIRVFPGARATARLLRTGKVHSSGAYRGGCCFLRCRLDAGVYVLICSTFKPGDLGNFQLCLHSAPASDEAEDAFSRSSASGKTLNKNENLALVVLSRLLSASQLEQALLKHVNPLTALRELLSKEGFCVGESRGSWKGGRRSQTQLMLQAKKLLESDEEERKSALPTLSPHPYPYAIPPDPRLFHQKLSGPSKESVIAKREWSRVALVVSTPARVSLRLEISTEVGLPLPALPEMALYIFSPGASPTASTCHSHLELVGRSDLQGGLSADGKTRSSAALDLLQREGVLNITLAELNDPSRVYVAYISTPREAASEERGSSSLPPLPWRLHVIATSAIQVCLL